MTDQEISGDSFLQASLLLLKYGRNYGTLSKLHQILQVLELLSGSQFEERFRAALIYIVHLCFDEFRADFG